MMFTPRRRSLGGRSLRAAVIAALAAGGVIAAPAVVSHAATTTTLYVSPTGGGTSCSAAAPCSVAQVKASVEAVDGNMTGDIVVQLAAGTYRLSAPLALGAADSGSNGHTVVWQAAAGATPVLSGDGR